MLAGRILCGVLRTCSFASIGVLVLGWRGVFRGSPFFGHATLEHPARLAQRLAKVLQHPGAETLARSWRRLLRLLLRLRLRLLLRHLLLRRQGRRRGT